MVEAELPALLKFLTHSIPDSDLRSHALERLMTRRSSWGDYTRRQWGKWCHKVARGRMIYRERREYRWGERARCTYMPDQPESDALTPLRLLELKEDLS